MEVLEITEENFKEKVLESSNKVLVDFNANWCGPCRMLKPVLDEIASETEILICSINVDDEENLAREYNVSSIPCLVLFEKGKEIGRSVGFKPKKEILDFIGDK